MARLTLQVRLPGRHGRPPAGAAQRQPRTNGEYGLFARDSVLRRMVSESVGLLGGGRSLLMQIAHPMVAAGVVEHSNFKSDPLARLERTLDITLGIVLADRASAMETLRSFHETHSRIRGQLPHDAGPFPAGTPYYAHDPALKLWVHATLIDGTLLTYERFVRPLTREEKRAYFEDSMSLARYFGIPDSIIPRDQRQFEEYLREMIEGDTLAVTKITKSIARDVLYPNVSAAPRTVGPLARFITAGLMPERLREAYGFTWDVRRQALLDSISGAVRIGLPLMPPQVRLMPQAGGGQLVQWAIRAGRRRAA